MVMVKPWESTIPHSRPDLGAAGVGAAFGRVQLRRLPQLLKRRRAMAARYDEMGRDWEVLHPPPQSSDIIYRYVVKLPPGRLDAAIATCDAQGVSTRRPVAAPRHGVNDAVFPGTKQMLDKALSLLLYPSLSDAEAQRVIRVADRVLCATPVPANCRRRSTVSHCGHGQSTSSQSPFRAVSVQRRSA